MRPLIPFAAALAVASAASAQPQDRYGPPRPAKERVYELAALRGYQGPILSWTGKRSPQPAAPQPVAAVAAPPDPEFAPTPAPQPPRAAYAPPRPRPQPPVLAQAARVAPPTPAPGAAGPRYYSLHREFGLAPDAMPEPPAQPRYVLIGPPDRPSEDEAPKTNPDRRAF